MAELNSIKAVVVDDELLARENLKMLLAEFCAGIHVVGDAGSVEEAIEVIKREQPDVLFLDIRMPSGAEGFELLDKLQNKSCQVVFVTAFKDYAIKAFRANAIDYILKPIDIEDLQKAVEKAKSWVGKVKEQPEELESYLHRLSIISKELQQGNSSKITIHHSKGIKIVDSQTIIRLEADGGCTKLFFDNGEVYLDTRNLKVYEDLLDHRMFFRVHKSHLINMNYLTDFSREEGNFALLSNGDKISVARAKVSEFIERIKAI